MRYRLVVTACLIVAGCHSSPQKSQAVAAGKDFEVTVPELDVVLAQAPAVSKEQIHPARVQILEALVAQKLFAQQAVAQKLDRDVTVMRALEDARRRILAGAYIDRLAASEGELTGREVLDFFNAHPNAFANRKLYTINQYAVPADSKSVDDYKAALDRGGIAALDARLAQDGIKNRPTNIVIPSDALPDAVAERLSKMPLGASVVFGTQAGLHLGVITAVQDASQDLDEARPSIEKRILQDRRTALVMARAEQLKRDRQVKIEDKALRTAN